MRVGDGFFCVLLLLLLFINATWEVSHSGIAFRCNVMTVIIICIIVGDRVSAIV